MYVTLVGRSNVGKSSLFNLLLSQGGRISSLYKSIVSDKPGTTRDAKYGHFYMYGNKINLIDTGDIDNSLLTNDNSKFNKLEINILDAIKKSRLILFILDGNDGVTPLDVLMCNKINHWTSEINNKPDIKLIINKIDNETSPKYYETISDCLAECYSLQLGEPIFISALQRKGISQIKQLIKQKLTKNHIHNLEESAILSNFNITHHEFIQTDPNEHENEIFSTSPEVQSNSLGPADSSPNSLPVNGDATPRDRGEEKVVRIRPQVEPVADLREAEGEVNRRAVCKTTSGGETPCNGNDDIVEGTYGVSFDEDFNYDVDKSIRTCTSVRECYTPNHKWIKLLNNVCGYSPFISDEDDRYIIPNVLSPGEQLARLYIPNEKLQYNNTSNEDSPHEVATSDPLAVEASPLEVQSNSLGPAVSSPNSLPVNGDATPRDRGDNSSEQYKTSSGKPVADLREAEGEVNRRGTTASGKTSGGVESSACSMENNISGECVRLQPLNVLVLHSVDTDCSSLMSILTDEELIFTGLTVNWNSYYTIWRTDEVELPIEYQVSAPLNIGGSLGKMSMKQTRILLNKCDYVLFCINHDGLNGGNNVELSLTKREMSWITRSIRCNKPIILIVISKVKVNSFKFNKIKSLSHEFESIPIIPLNLSSKSTFKNKIYQLFSNFEMKTSKINTNLLNNWLKTFTEKWPPPWFKGSKVNIKFASHIRIKPPTFLLWSNVYATFPQHYLRQLKTALSNEFNLNGIPIKIILKTTFNKPNGIKGKRKFIR